MKKIIKSAYSPTIIKTNELDSKAYIKMLIQNAKRNQKFKKMKNKECNQKH